MIRTSVIAVLFSLGFGTSAISQTPAPTELRTPADPLSYVEGDWYDVRRKIKVTVSEGTVTISEFDTESSLPRQYRVGTVIGRLRAGRQDGERSYRFTGECIEPNFDGVSSAMVNCFDLQQLTASRSPDGSVFNTLKVKLLELRRREAISEGEWAARR
ncbi:hypothetical protein [Brevundimonas sp.]|nr:hypothetical protein [Brevundimonas sp.]MDQ7813625.1 hypothetical protein [Brevundimonas sp.]